MRLNETVTATVILGSPAESEGSLVCWLGYCHAAEGKAYDPDYDQLPTHMQINYERGRAVATMLRARLGYVPLWPTSQRLSAVVMGVLPRAEVDAMAGDLAIFQS